MKNKVIVIDLASMPHNQMTAKEWFEIYNQEKILFYESIDYRGHRTGDKPYSIDGSDLGDKVLVDVSTEEGRKILEEIRERSK